MTYGNETQDMYTIMIARKNGRVHNFRYRNGNEAHNKFVFWGSSAFVQYFSTAVALFGPDGHQISVWRFDKPNVPDNSAECTIPNKPRPFKIKETTTTHE